MAVGANYLAFVHLFLYTRHTPSASNGVGHVHLLIAIYVVELHDYGWEFPLAVCAWNRSGLVNHCPSYLPVGSVSNMSLSNIDVSVF